MRIIVALNFIVFRKKVEDGRKRRTAREPRKRRWKIGDELQIYWKQRTKKCELLFETKLIHIERKLLEDFTELDATEDGFDSLEQFKEWFLKRHKKYINSKEYKKKGGFDFLTWDYDNRILPKYRLRNLLKYDYYCWNCLISLKSESKLKKCPNCDKRL